jgi:hypothetical protein
VSRTTILRASAALAAVAALFSLQSSLAAEEISGAPAAASAQPVRTVKIPEGTEVRIQFDEQLSSATSSSGDTFSISTDEEIKLPDGTVIPAGYRGKGEVTSAEKNGMMGKAGQLNVRMVYVRIGDTRVRLRASKGQEGQGAVTSTVVLTVLFGPIGLLKHGHNIVIPKGQTMTAFVDGDTDVGLPLAPPPQEN